MSDKYSYFESMPEHRFIERHLVMLAIEELAKDGWQVERFEDEEHEFTQARDAVSAWAAFDTVDMGWLHFVHTSGETAWVFIVGGNGRGVIRDCTQNISDPLDRVFLY